MWLCLGSDTLKGGSIDTVIAPNWSELSHAFGRADLPEILKALSPDPGARAWSDLWDRVCHQGTTYPASPYVLPRLLEIAQSWGGTGRVMPLVLASDIVASREFKIGGFEETVEGLRTMACRTVAEKALSRSDRIYLMSAALSLTGEDRWGPELVHLNDEEFMGICPSCKTELYLTIGENGYFVSKEDPVGANARGQEIVPCEIDALNGIRAWLHEIAINAADTELATRIRCLFGRSTCPICAAPFEIAESIERFWRS